jgi:hypothetical protein
MAALSIFFGVIFGFVGGPTFEAERAICGAAG